MNIIQVFPILCIAFTFISFNLIPGCSPKEIAPFNNGDFFEYQQSNKDYKKLYQIEKSEDGMFKITWRHGRLEPDEFIVDQTGKIIETPSYSEGSLARDLFYERQIILWLPASKRKIGEAIHFCDFIGTNVVTAERKWQKWDVWVARHSNVFGWQENYFDKETGFLVGSQSAGDDLYILTDSSVERLTSTQRNTCKPFR